MEIGREGSHMPVTITLNDTLAEQLHTRAQTQQISLEELIVNILNDALEPANGDHLTPEDVVAKIKTIPPNHAHVRFAQGSLLESLQHTSDFPDFDLETWQKEWAHVEREMKAITRANDIAEGRK
jgi:hypothetical protein